jgi:CDP-2,3-bis-(O-geranylgeranyl)-sn-glycerol synthase
MTGAGTALLLLLVANGAPILAARVLRHHLDAPLDGGRTLADGRPLLGPHKTVRGVVAAVVAAAALGAALGLPPPLGAAVGATAMLGDAVSSFLKRRLGLGSGGRASGLDQLPETILPLLVLRAAGVVDWIEAALALLGFLVLGAGLSRVLFFLGVRQRPY